MLDEIRKELLERPETVQSIFEHYGFANVRIHKNYISCGRDEDSSPKAIVMKLENNKYCYVTDYARNVNKDLFSFLMMRECKPFKEIFLTVGQFLGHDELQLYGKPKRQLFGGFYNRIGKKRSAQGLNIYPESILDPYEVKYNMKFLKDNISLDAQKYFGLRFDIENNGIIIPIRDQIGSLVGVKVRNNWDSEDEGFIKYWYAVSVAASQTLYGYCQNYPYLLDRNILVFESEKSVMQAYTYGYRNAVALGSGSISKKQVQMMLEINPASICLLHDKGYDEESVKRNVDMIKGYSAFIDIPIRTWKLKKNGFPDKSSPTDKGKEKFMEVVKYGLVLQN